MILSYTLILHISQVQTQQLMMSQIRPHIEYLTQTYHFFLCLFYTQNWWKIYHHWRFIIRFNHDSC